MKKESSTIITGVFTTTIGLYQYIVNNDNTLYLTGIILLCTGIIIGFQKK